MKKRLLISGVGITLFFFSCSPKYYSPNTQNVPLMREKGQTNLQVSGNGNMAEFQGAYGISDKFAIQANGALYVPKNEDNGNGGSGNLLEGGFGYYRLLAPRIVFESYALLGVGAFENHFPGTVDQYPGTDGKISANLFRYGVQPGIGYFSRYFSAALSTRLVGLSYSNIRGNLVFGEQNQQFWLSERRSGFLIEPALTLRAGLERVKFQLQIGASFNATHSDFKQDDSYATLGLHFRFGT